MLGRIHCKLKMKKLKIENSKYDHVTAGFIVVTDVIVIIKSMDFLSYYEVS